MDNTIVSLITILVLYITTTSQGRKTLKTAHEFSTSSLVTNNGICKTMVETQGYRCEEYKDLDVVEALIQGLVLFQGGILMVNNDEHLISGSVEELWIVSEGRVAPFHGTFVEYQKTLHSS